MLCIYSGIFSAVQTIRGRNNIAYCQILSMEKRKVMAENKPSSTKKASANSTNKKSDKLHLRPIWGIALAVAAIALFILGLKACSAVSEKDPVQASVDIIDINAQVQSIEETKGVEQTLVKIDLQSCKIVVGEKIYVTATVMPADTGKSLQWKSSDEKVFKVNNDGILEVTGVGTAALTATVGDVSDAIVIEGVENENSNSQLNLPGYNEVINNPGTGDGRETSAQHDTQQGESSQGENITQGMTQSPSAYTPQPSAPPQTQPVQPTEPVTVPVVPTTQAEESRGLRSSQLPEVLGGYGYHASGENVYVYGEGSSYAGEIIVQHELVIIYIKQETEGYSSAVQQVLAQLLPDEHAQAWNNYKSATTDRTFTLEGRKVRIVTAANGGHSQIVVYN